MKYNINLNVFVPWMLSQYDGLPPTAAYKTSAESLWPLSLERLPFCTGNVSVQQDATASWSCGSGARFLIVPCFICLSVCSPSRFISYLLHNKRDGGCGLLREMPGQFLKVSSLLCDPYYVIVCFFVFFVFFVYVFRCLPQLTEIYLEKFYLYIYIYIYIYASIYVPIS
jgi:hypothetical protein